MILMVAVLVEVLVGIGGVLSDRLILSKVFKKGNPIQSDHHTVTNMQALSRMSDDCLIRYPRISLMSDMSK
jgi:hypothetical protein